MQSLVKTETPAAPIVDEIDLTETGSGGPRPWYRSVAEIVVMLLILVGLLNTLTISADLSSSSMEPTLNPGDHVIASRITYALHSPDRGDVVVMRDPLSKSGLLVRRVVGLPGELVELRGRQVLIDGQPLTENYIGNPLLIGDNITATSQTQLRDNQYYLMGDNRLSINDSRSWGAVTGDLIQGRAWVVDWPPESIGFVKHERYEQTVSP
jgi:signal peptidase I